jgi:hypothetical protein
LQNQSAAWLGAKITQGERLRPEVECQDASGGRHRLKF